MTAATPVARITPARVDGSLAFVAPADPAWERAEEALVALEPTPLDQQPSAYVQRAWAGRPRGDVPAVAVRALVSEETVMLRLSWRASPPSPGITDYDAYADACGVLFPANGQTASLGTMGDESAPVTAWHWRAGAQEPFVVTARGLGTAEREGQHALRASGQLAGSTWTVVFAHPRAGGPQARPGAPLPVGFAVWAGGAAERAGLKSHTPRWQELWLAGAAGEPA
jgi:DMSO reductase family type II enzyme heme b subunit